MQRVRALPGQALVPHGEKRNPYQTDDLGLSMYTCPPNEEVSIREFEDFTVNRLKLLHLIDKACGGRSKAGTSSEFRLENMGALRPQLARDLRDCGLSLGYPKADRVNGFLLEKAEFQSRDNISHFALRLAFCKSNEAREWLLKQEQRLFVLRFEGLNTDAKEAFVESTGIRAQRFEEPSEGGPTLSMLQKCTAGVKTWRDGRAEIEQVFYAMPFTEVPPAFIAGRRVVVKKGKAYVPASSLKMIVAKKFKDLLAASLDVAFQGIHMALADPRVGLFLRQLQEMGMQLVLPMRTSSTEEAGEKLNLGNFEELLSRSLPPCMRRLVERQRETKKHLKHAGRLQLRPFLKDCGFSFEDSVSWWKQELCRDPTIDSGKFDKNYMYDLEHAYGKKGHLQGQNCRGCPKLIGLPGEAVGQVHGCPFKQMDPKALQQQLQRWRVPSAYVGEIERLIKEGKRYQEACIEYFKSQHPNHEGDGVGNSPLDFFKESCVYHKKKAKDAAKGESAGNPAPVADASKQ